VDKTDVKVDKSRAFVGFYCEFHTLGRFLLDCAKVFLCPRELFSQKSATEPANTAFGRVWLALAAVMFCVAGGKKAAPV
jgi:hypothetical protein